MEMGLLVSLIVKQTPALTSQQFFSWMPSERNENMATRRGIFFTNVTDSLTYHSPKLETTQVSIRIDGQILLHLHSGKLCGNEKGQALLTACLNLTGLSAAGRSQTQESSHCMVPCMRSSESMAMKMRAVFASGAGVRMDCKGHEETIGTDGITLGLGWGAGSMGVCVCQNPLSCTVRVCVYTVVGEGVRKLTSRRSW